LAESGGERSEVWTLMNGRNHNAGGVYVPLADRVILSQADAQVTVAEIDAFSVEMREGWDGLTPPARATCLRMANHLASLRKRLAKV